MTSRIARLTLAVALLCPRIASHAQTGDTAKPFLTGPCSATESFVDLDSLDAEPDERASVSAMSGIPVPPAELRNKDHEVKLVAAFVVDTAGVVRPGRMAIMSSNDSELSRWACDVVPKMRFIAARHHGHAVASQVLMPFTFRPPVRDSVPAATGSRPYLEAEVEKQVTLDRPAFPRYPPDAKKERIEGRVQAQFVVDTMGRAEMGTFHVLHATDNRFIEPVRHAVAMSTYHPAEFHGRKVRQIVQEPFTFSLGPE